MPFSTRNVIVCNDGYCLVDHKNKVCCAFCPEVDDCEEKCEPMQENDTLGLCTHQKSIKIDDIISFKPTGKSGLRYYEPCYSCGESLGEENEDYYVYGGEKYCFLCFDETFSTCGYCGEVHHQESMRYCEDKEYDICDSCYSEYFEYCSECDELFHQDDVTHIHDGDRVCDRCLSKEYATCDDCGELRKLNEISISDIEAESLCPYCWNRNVVECDGCGMTGDKDNMHEVDNEMFCEGCYEGIEEEQEESEGESEGGN